MLSRTIKGGDSALEVTWQIPASPNAEPAKRSASASGRSSSYCSIAVGSGLKNLRYYGYRDR
jgi:hypothetical protein